MVDVGVGEDHVVDGLRINRKVAVLFERLFAVALVQSAIEQDALAARFNEVHGSGSRLRGSEKRYFHGSSFLSPGGFV
jgi:hypothetical protein